MLAFLFSRAGLIALALAAAIGLFGLQEIRLKLAQSGEAHAKAAAQAAGAALGASETRRAAEHADAVKAVSDAEIACAARVDLARKSGAAIRKIVEKPVALDPTTHCPLRALVGAGELRDAVAPH